MKAIDACTIDKIGIPQSVLMERAALAVAEEIERINPEKGRVLIAVDGGNNGGDGLAAARILSERGYPVDIYYVGGITEVSEQFEIQSCRHQRAVRRIRCVSDNRSLAPCCVKTISYNDAGQMAQCLFFYGLYCRTY